MIDWHNAQVFWALVQRDLIMIKKRLSSTLLTGVIQITTSVVLFGRLFPTMGVSDQLIAPLFIGQACFQMFFLGNAMGFRTIYDIKYSRFIDYRLTLPLPKRWLFGATLLYFVIETTIITLPLLLLGTIFLAPQFAGAQPNWLIFIITYFQVLCMYGLMFMSLSYYYTPEWYMNNIFPRRLTLLIGISPVFYTWFKAYAFSPNASLIVLASPLTYAFEGMRVALLGGPNYISPLYCIPMLALFSGVFCALLAYGIKKRLDPV